jgi:AcrR family transcriptional regulator
MTRKREKPRKTPVQARAKVTWNAILDAAAQVLIKHGYEKATTDRIAQRAGVSIGSVYEYFPNKEAIFAALTLRWNEQRWEVLQAPQGALQPSALAEDQRAEGQSGLAAAIRAAVRARIAATRLNPQLNAAINLEVPNHVTEQQSKRIYDEFIRVSVAALAAFTDEIREGNLEFMASLVIVATHAAVDNIAASNPEMLASKEFENELSLMMYRYIAK